MLLVHLLDKTADGFNRFLLAHSSIKALFLQITFIQVSKRRTCKRITIAVPEDDGGEHRARLHSLEDDRCSRAADAALVKMADAAERDLPEGYIFAAFF